VSAPATLEGVLAMGQLEAAFLDNGLRYSRRFTPARKHVPRDERLLPQPPENGIGVYLNVEEETWEMDDVETSPLVNIMPLKTHVNMGGQQRRHAGALDPVLQAAAIAAAIAPNGRRVRSLRPYITLVSVISAKASASHMLISWKRSLHWCRRMPKDLTVSRRSSERVRSSPMEQAHTARF